jgi:hypothetical protein
LGALAVTQSDDDGDMKSLIGGAIAAAVKSMAFGLSRRCWDRRHACQSRKGSF